MKKFFHFMCMGWPIQHVASGRAELARMKAGSRSRCVTEITYLGRRWGGGAIVWSWLVGIGLVRFGSVWFGAPRRAAPSPPAHEGRQPQQVRHGGHAT